MMSQRFQSLKGFGGLWNSEQQRQRLALDLVSIPERVWWFVEQPLPQPKHFPYRFQSLKGFGGLWNL